MSRRFVTVPLRYGVCRDFIEQHHRTHADGMNPSHVFSLGAVEAGTLVGVIMVTRPVSRVLAADAQMTLEVHRAATDGTEHANSYLYAAAARAAFALGYDRLITYTQEGESGATMRAAGWRIVAERPPRGSWNAKSRPRIDRGGGGARTLWETP